MSEKVKAVVSALVVLIVNAAALFGMSIDSDTLTQIVSGIAMLIATLWAIWKNHNFTDEAVQAQAVLDELKSDDDDDDIDLDDEDEDEETEAAPTAGVPDDFEVA